MLEPASRRLLAPELNTVGVMSTSTLCEPCKPMAGTFQVVHAAAVCVGYNPLKLHRAINVALPLDSLAREVNG